MHVSALLVVNLTAMHAGLKIIIKLIGLVAITTDLGIELVASTSQTESKVLCDFAAIIIALMNKLLEGFALFLPQGRTPTPTHITSTPLCPTTGTHTMPITLSGATVVLHANSAIKNNVAVPVMVITERLPDGTIVGVNHFLNLE
jgi:hypothetical protein